MIVRMVKSHRSYLKVFYKRPIADNFVNGIRIHRYGSFILYGAALLAIMVVVSSGACGSWPAATVTAPSVDQNPPRLPSLRLVDQHNQPLDLDLLRGKFVLAAFIYTACPGPCLVTTARMAGVATHLTDLIGTRLTLVSFTVDPEHDRPDRLLSYAHEQGADRVGWLFLTGRPAQIDEVMGKFNLVREREPGGLINHVVFLFFLGPDGRELAAYDPVRDTPDAIAQSMRRAMMLQEGEDHKEPQKRKDR